MALIKCYECGKDISDKAPSCPHCGAPQLVSKNKEVKAKKPINFKQYLKPIGIGLGVIFIPLAAVASVPLIQANGNIDAVVWRFQNQKFIKNRCSLNKFRAGPHSKKCKSLLFKLGEKAENISKKPHSYCIGLKKVKDISSYEECIRQEDKMIKKQKELERLARKERNQYRGRNALIYKGKTYTASRICPVGQNMYWSVTSGFMRKTKVSELGCMTKAQNEAFWRDYNLRQAGAPSGGSGAGRAASDRINNQTQRSINNMNRDWQNRYNNWHQKEFGY